MGIGRPSTYASIIETIQAREYVQKRGSALVPTWVAFAVTRLLEQHLASLVDYQFTAQMEDYLDAISRREAEHVKYLHDFYFGDGNPGLREQLNNKTKEIDPRLMSRFAIGTPESGEHREEIVLRVGKYGPFLEQGERRASIPDGMAPDELNLERAIEILEQGQLADEPLGICPETHKPVFIKTGRFGPYIQLGTTDEGEKPKNASLLKGMEPDSIDLGTALKLLSLPRTLGEHPESKEPVVAHNGRFGPYVKCAAETRSLPAEISPLDVTLEKALELLAQPKTRGARGAPKEPLKVLEASPVTEEPIKLLDGRYGSYVTDGESNASLPKGMQIEELTFEVAVQLLAERAARAPTKKKKKKAAKKKAKAKSATTATKKKAAKKKKKATKKKAV
jgi:DNA topoisomerase-1